MQHRGEIVEKAVRESGYPITSLAKRLGKSRRWVYLAFDNRNLSLDIILKIGHIIHHNFAIEISDLRNNMSVMTIEDSGNQYYAKTTHDAEYWKDKYLTLLEEYNNLLKSIK